jgi:hypothetical protein
MKECGLRFDYYLQIRADKNTSKIACFLPFFEGFFWRLLQHLPMISHKSAHKKIQNFFGKKTLDSL